MPRVRIAFMKKAILTSKGGAFCTNRRSDSLTSLAKLRVLPCPRLGHDHDVLKLQVVVEFRLVFGRDAAVLGAFDQLSHAFLDAIGRTERDATTASGVVPPR